MAPSISAIQLRWYNSILNYRRYNIERHKLFYITIASNPISNILIFTRYTRFHFILTSITNAGANNIIFISFLMPNIGARYSVKI